jgi:predicted  nucleic acid-binding Zn-ribbon protein
MSSRFNITSTCLQLLIIGSPITGAPEKIAALRTRYSQLASSIAHHESRVNKQTAQLNRMNRPQDYNGDGDEEDNLSSQDMANESSEQEVEITEEDLKKEEYEISELEKKKKALEGRVHEMEKDLGGLLR